MGHAELITEGLLRDWPLPELGDYADKSTRGSVHVVGGTAETAGAVLLAGVAALRVGAGRLAITTAQETAVALSVAVPEAMVTGVKDPARAQLPHVPDCVVIGPGTSEAFDARRLLAGCDGAAAVLDAGALRDLPDELPTRCVLTPNLDELERLGSGPEELAERTGAVVATHGSVAAPDGRCWRVETGSVALGTSGSGDVLAGIVGGLLARGAEAAQAACWGQHLHGLAAQKLAPTHGRVGLLARELLDVLPGLLEELTR